MNLCSLIRARDRRDQGYSFVETMVGVMLMGFTLGGLFTGISMATTIIVYGREETKAVEIVSETLDSIRLYSWNQITNKTFMPRTFTVNTADSGRLQWVYGTNETEVVVDESVILEQSLSSNGTSRNQPMDSDLAALDSASSSDDLTDSSTPVLDDSGGTPTDGDQAVSSQKGVYTGSITVGDAPITEAYGSTVKMVTVRLQWISHNKTNTTSMQTLITQYGLQGRIVN